MSSSGGQQSGGSGVSFPTFSGAGSPEGVQVGSVGEYYEDTDNGNLYNKASGTATDTGWIGPLVIGGSNEYHQADNTVTLPADAASTLVPADFASPPEWLNTTGDIILPGAYIAIYQFFANAAATTPGLYLGFTGANNLDDNVPVDPLTALGPAKPNEIINATAADIPWTFNVRVQMPTDATLTVDVRLAISRYIYNVS